MLGAIEPAFEPYFNVRRKDGKDRNNAAGQNQKFYGGPGRIRTFEGISQQIYSLSRLTASVPTHDTICAGAVDRD